MAITDATRKRLWGRSGLRCAYCRNRIILPSDDATGEILIGIECHVRAQSPGGPRYDPTLNAEAVDAFENLLILCPNDHTVVDRDLTTFTVERLLELKRAHEQWVDETLSYR